MKKIITTLFSLLALVSMAQNKISVSESSQKFSVGSQNAFIVTAYVKDGDKLLKAFKDKMKDWDGKVSGKKEIFFDDVLWKTFSENSFDAYALIEEVKGEGFRLVVAINLGGAYLNSNQHGEQARMFKNMLQELAIKVTKEEVGDEVKDETKKLVKLEDQQKDLEKDNANLKADIENYKKKIAEAEQKIKENEQAQEKKKEEVSKQKEVVKTVETKLKNVQ